MGAISPQQPPFDAFARPVPYLPDVDPDGVAGAGRRPWTVHWQDHLLVTLERGGIAVLSATRTRVPIAERTDVPSATWTLDGSGRVNCTARLWRRG